MVEYYLSDLASATINNSYLNRSNIQKSLFLDSYILYLDYSNNVYLEIKQSEDELEANSLW